MSLTSTPASISSAAIRCEAGARVLVHELAGVGDQRRRRAPRRSPGVISAPSRFASSSTISAVHEASVSTRLTVPKRVLSWWWSMFSSRAPSRCRNSTGIRSMLPQSRKTSVRSTTSAGGSWKTSSSGRKRYSTGSGNSFAARNITESLPSWLEDVVHRQQRAERVAVGALVGGEQEAVARLAARRRRGRDRPCVRPPRPTGLAHLGPVLEQPAEADAALEALVVVEASASACA